MPVPSALLFDLDGTLVDSESTHTRSIAVCLEQHGIRLTPEERAFVVGHAWQEIYAYLDVATRTGLSLRQLQEGAVAAKYDMMARGLRFECLPGVRELVQLGARLNVPMAIVSGSSRAEIRQVLPVLDIEAHLQFYIGAEDVTAGKPSPEGYLLAAERLAVVPSTCLVFEDSHAGVQAAVSAGMRVIATTACAVARGDVGYQDVSRAHRIVAGLDVVTHADLVEVMEVE